MTRSEIIEMARQAGIGWGEGIGGMTDFLESFAKLVSEKEREKFCAVLRQLHDSYSLTSDSNAIRARGQE